MKRLIGNQSVYEPGEKTHLFSAFPYFLHAYYFCETCFMKSVVLEVCLLHYQWFSFGGFGLCCKLPSHTA